MRKLNVLLALLITSGLLSAQVKTKDVEENEWKIIKEVINPQIYKVDYKEIKTPNPDWDTIQNILSKNYDRQTIVKAILKSKQNFYSVAKDWNAYAKAWLEYADKYVRVDTITNSYMLLATVNNPLYEYIFKNVENKKLLLRAAKISKKVVENPNSLNKRHGVNKEKLSKANVIDTYANLLYKGGKLKDAVLWETKAVELTSGKNVEFSDKLEKMKAGQPTW